MCNIESAKHTLLATVLACLVVLLLAACTQAEPSTSTPLPPSSTLEPTGQASAEIAAESSTNVEPTETPTDVPTSTPTLTPEPTETPTPEPTATPTPTQVPMGELQLQIRGADSTNLSFARVVLTGDDIRRQVSPTDSDGLVTFRSLPVGSDVTVAVEFFLHDDTEATFTMDEGQNTETIEMVWDEASFVEWVNGLEQLTRELSAYYETAITGDYSICTDMNQVWLGGVGLVGPLYQDRDSPKIVVPAELTEVVDIATNWLDAMPDEDVLLPCREEALSSQANIDSTTSRLAQASQLIAEAVELTAAFTASNDN